MTTRTKKAGKRRWTSTGWIVNFNGYHSCIVHPTRELARDYALDNKQNKIMRVQVTEIKPKRKGRK